MGMPDNADEARVILDNAKAPEAPSLPTPTETTAEEQKDEAPPAA